jgi:hypothetical protein
MVRIRDSVVAAALFASLPGSSSALDPLIDSSDVRISSSREWESTVSVSPRDRKVILVGNNLLPAVESRSVAFWTSTDGGKTWDSAGFMGPAGGTDPAAAISGKVVPKGRLLANFMTHSTEGDLVVRHRNNASGAWSAADVVSKPFLDKPHIWVDNSSHSDSLHRYNVYCAWSQAVEVEPNQPRVDEIRIKRSLTDGSTWPDFPEILDHGQSWRGVHIQTGRTGRVYAVWPRLLGAGFGFSESNEAVPATFDMNDPRGLSIGSSYHFPVMAVDKSDAERDHLYLVWATAAFTSATVKIMKGSADFPNQLVVWDSLNIGTVAADSAHMPWITWDDCTGMLAVVWLDLRNPAGRETYVAVAETRNANGAFLNANSLSWTEFKVSDTHWTTAAHPGVGTYDYIGIAAAGGHAYPVWSDDRTGAFRPYTSEFVLGGVIQSSIQHTIVSNGPALELTVRANWNTTMATSGTDSDSFVLTSPTNVVYTGSATPGSPGTSHEVTQTCTCEPGHWKYVVKSTRPGLTSCASDEKTFNVSACLD